MDQPYSDRVELPWGAAKKALFRACFLFFVLFILLAPSEIIPADNPVYDVYIHPFHLLVPWMGKHILHLSYEVIVPSYAAGDSSYDILMLLLMAVMTALGCLVWTIADRKRKDYRVLFFWLTVLVRYFCAFCMLSPGLSKLYKLQFGFPSPGSLIQPLGTYSPMHLAWAFFGYSSVYNYFLGGIEFITGLLLLFRRTTRLGVLLLLGIVANIAVINYCYDVTVKVLSSVLMVMAFFLLWQQRRQLINFFFRNKPVMTESEWTPQFGKKWVHPVLVFVKYSFIIGLLCLINMCAIGFLKDYSDNRPRPSLYGIFNVRSFVRNRDTLAPVMTDTIRWRRLIIGSGASVRGMNDSAKSYVFLPDTVRRTITMYRAADSAHKSYFVYAFIGKDSLRLQGLWKGDSVSIVMQKYDLNNFILVNRGFHLINEVPYQK